MLDCRLKSGLRPRPLRAFLSQPCESFLHKVVKQRAIDEEEELAEADTGTQHDNDYQKQPAELSLPVLCVELCQ